MTTFTSSIASRTFAPLLLPVLLVAGCGPAGNGRAENASATAPDGVADRPATATAPATPVAVAGTPGGKQDLTAVYTADLAQAVAGARKIPFRAKGDIGGMTCSPATISGKDAASRALTLTLPENAETRAHVLAVVTPERGLLEIYSPYDGAAEADDLVIPSQTIAWAKARTRNVFTTNTDQLDGLRPGRDAPEPLFLEAGRYRFALVSGIDAALLKANGAQVEVMAACSFDWTP
jgi:hypothetical protein